MTIGLVQKVTPSRTLLVEDFEPFRRLIRRTLEKRVSIQIVGEAVDGIEAVQKAQELQPDLILLDIGLPKLNGIGAALQIHTLVPNAKILFISLEASDATVRQAFRAGGHGYIHKMRSQLDIIPAIEAVLAGKRFVSCGVEYEDDAKLTGRHELHFYSDEPSFVDIASRYVGDALRAKGAAIVFATPSHRSSLLQRLKDDDLDMDNAIQERAYIALDVFETFSATITTGTVDNAQAAEILNDLVQVAIKARKSQDARIAMLSELSPVLCEEGHIHAAIHVESRGNSVIQALPLDILCAYPLALVRRSNDEGIFKTICAAHTGVFSR
jgi:CheY-like chemotaxis protein